MVQIKAKRLVDNAPFLNSILNAKHNQDRKIIVHAAKHEQLMLLFTIARSILQKKNSHLFKANDRKKLESYQEFLKTFVTKSSQLRRSKK